jgi:DNA-directed RNA polymerases I, II, and III subunit RPABC2
MADEDDFGGGGMDDYADMGDAEEEEEELEEGDDHEEGFEVRDAEAVDSKAIPTSNYCTTPYLTKYERARVLGTRALQIRWVCQLSALHLVRTVSLPSSFTCPV